KPVDTLWHNDRRPSNALLPIPIGWCREVGKMRKRVSAALGGAVFAAALAIACQPGLSQNGPLAVSAGTAPATTSAGTDRARPAGVLIPATVPHPESDAPPAISPTPTTEPYRPRVARDGEIEQSWHGTGPKVAVLGDSLTVQSKAQLQDELRAYSVKIGAINGEGLSGGAFSRGLWEPIMPTAARAYAADPPAVLVVALGTNDVWRTDLSATTFSRAWTELRSEFPRSCLVGVTVTETTRALMYDSMEAKRVNAIIRGDSDVVVDWANRGPASTYTTGDNIHLTPKGRTLHAALVGDGIQQCLAQGTPRARVPAPAGRYRSPQSNG
ncbi:MAG: GDSL-type esterase/lipase family protein, partial [Aquihabitans sp.]